MWGAGTTQAEWSRSQDETHYQSYLHHLGQQPALQQQREDQWSLPHGACLFLLISYFIPSNNTTFQIGNTAQMWKKGLYQRLLAGLCGGILQVTNEIIRLCTRSISLDQIFEGYVSSSRTILNDCICCCLSWKETYCRASQIQKK